MPTPDQSRHAQRVLCKDASFWSDDIDVQTNIMNRLGWLDAIEISRDQQDTLKTFVRDFRRRGFRRVLLLGMGGSYLAPKVIARVCGAGPGCPDLITLDSTSPEQILDIRAQIDPRETLVIVSSKSGNTIETLSLYRYFMNEFASAGLEEPAGHFVAITDEGSALHREADDRGFLHCFLNHPAIGGRYSALSLFGLVPAALLGVNIPAVLAAAEAARDACARGEGEGARLGEWLAAGWHAGRDKLALVLPEEYQVVGGWIEQLVAESLGKDGKGILPYLETDLERAARPDSLCIDWKSPKRVDEDPDWVRSAEIPGEEDLGGFFFNWEFATAVAGGLLGVNPFDEPDVAETKRNTARYLEQSSVQANVSALKSSVELPTFLKQVKKGGYVAVLAYLPQTPGTSSARMRGLKQGIERLSQVPVIFTQGPRYLHSVGQYHKGGPDTGLFLIVVDDAHPELPVPGETYGFGTLISAQALGDYQALKAKGRPVMMIAAADIPHLD